ncbi:MAG: hypothetical protein CL910_03865 [Deltaproteobacteria bacterium]|nr:hypothetical protein [Deltaproteobacteria bacterium]
MNARVGILAAAGAGLALLAATSGGFGAGLALALAVGLGVLAYRLHRSSERSLPPWIVAAGAAAMWLGAGWLLAGAGLAGLGALGLGALVLLTGSQISLYQTPLPEGVELPAPLALRTNLAAALDESMRFVWAVTALLSPRSPVARIAGDLREAARRHEEEGILADPSRAHPHPPALEKFRLTRERVPRLGSIEQLRFESEYVARDPEIRDAYASIASNQTAVAHLFRHGDRPRPTLVCIHGYGMGRIGLDAWQWDIDTWHRGLGLDLAMPVLPLHGPRAPGRRSGAGFLDGHPLQTNAAFGQAIWELRRLIGWLRQQGAPAVGVTGMSLGGYTTALLASLEQGLACAIPTIPAVSLSELLAQDLSEEALRAREREGLDAALWEKAWAPHAPLGHRPRVAPEARLIVGARADRICPPAQTHALWKHWDEPSLHWTPGSHLAPIGRGETRDRVVAHLRETLLAVPTPSLSRFAMR